MASICEGQVSEEEVTDSDEMNISDVSDPPDSDYEISDTVRPTIGDNVPPSLQSSEQIESSICITPGQATGSGNNQSHLLPATPIEFESSSSDIPGTDSSIIAELNGYNYSLEVGGKETSSNQHNSMGKEIESETTTKKRSLSSSPLGENSLIDLSLLEFPMLNSQGAKKKTRKEEIKHLAADKKSTLETTDYEGSQTLENNLNPENQVESDEQSTMEFTGFDNQSLNQTPLCPISKNKNQIIIVEPLKDHRDPIKFFSNEVAIVKGLQNSNFKKCQIIDSHRNISKKLLMVEVKLNEGVSLEEITSIDKIGDWKVKCKLPIFERVCHGVIGPVGVETADDAILDSIQERYPDALDVNRIKKGKEKTLSVKVTFKGTILPERINALYRSFKVNQYIDKPWQCFNCQGFGHDADGCNFKTRCLLCGGPHQLKACPEKGKTIPKKCTNCGKDHLACYGGCPYMKTAKKVEEVRAKQKLSYGDAVKVVKSIAQSKQQSENNSTINRQRQPNLQDSSHVKSVSVGTQTEVRGIRVDNPTRDILAPSMFAQMAIMVVELLKIGKENPNEMNYSTALEVAHRISKMRISPITMNHSNQSISEEDNVHDRNDTQTEMQFTDTAQTNVSQQNMASQSNEFKAGVPSCGELPVTENMPVPQGSPNMKTSSGRVVRETEQSDTGNLTNPSAGVPGQSKIPKPNTKKGEKLSQVEKQQSLQKSRQRKPNGNNNNNANANNTPIAASGNSQRMRTRRKPPNGGS